MNHIGDKLILSKYSSNIFRVMTVFLFIEEYCRYFLVTFKSSVKYYCDNLRIIIKLKNIQSDHTLHSDQYKTTKYDSVLILQTYLLINLQEFYVKGHQDTRWTSSNLKIQGQLTIKADKQIYYKARTPIVIYIYICLALL